MAPPEIQDRLRKIYENLGSKWFDIQFPSPFALKKIGDAWCCNDAPVTEDKLLNI